MSESAINLRVSYAGVLPSDRMHSLKFYDQQVIDAFESIGVSMDLVGERISFKDARGKLKKLIGKQMQYANCLRKSSESASFLHISNHAYSYLGRYSEAPVSITCHDLAELHHSEQPALKYRLWKSRMKWLPNANHIFCISNHTLNDVVNHFGVDRSKVSVNYNGFFPLKKIAIGDLSSEGRSLFKQKKNEFYIFHPGVTLWRKNIPILLEALALLKRRGIAIKLVKAGDYVLQSHENLVRKHHLRNLIIDLGRVSLSRLNELYSICDVLAFPSSYEGFGLPVLEAQSCGLPCVLSNATALPEVGGAAALYHDKNSSTELADHLQRLYEDKRLRDELIDAGMSNIKRFSWVEHAKKIIETMSQ